MSREFLLGHKALARSRVVAAGDTSGIELAIEWLMTEGRPELIFVDSGMGDPNTAALTDFTIHVVNGSRLQMSEEDAAGAARSNLLVLNKTHIGAPLDPERDVAVRESIRIRGAAPCVVADLRYGSVHWRTRGNSWQAGGGRTRRRHGPSRSTRTSC